MVLSRLVSLLLFHDYLFGRVMVSATTTIRMVAQTERTLDIQTLQIELTDFKASNPQYTVGLVRGPQSTTDLFKLILNTYLIPQNPGIDIFPSDVIWPGDLSAYLMDLLSFSKINENNNSIPFNISDFENHMIDNTLINGRLVTVPWFTDYPLLYYRKDLLLKYFNDSTPPTTWDEMEYMAEVIQEGVRNGDGNSSGNADFWGYVWQGKAYEGLTCNVLEWVSSHGGGALLRSSSDRTVTVNNEYAKKAFRRALGWMGNITPYTVVGFDETSSEEVWLEGNAAFMRNWPYAIADSNTNDLLRGRFGITLMPRDDGPEGKHSGTLGGWNLAVSAFSEHPDAAFDLVSFLSSAQQQRFRFQQQCSIPTRDAVRNDPLLCNRSSPVEVTACDVSLSSDYIVPRPSTAASPHYSDLSRVIYTSVNGFLISNSDKLGTLDDFMLQLECDLANLLFAPEDMPRNCVIDQLVSTWVVALTLFVVAIGIVVASLTITFVFVAWDSTIIKASSQVFMMVLGTGIWLSFLYQLLLIGIATSDPRKSDGSGGTVGNGAPFAWGCYAAPFLAGFVFTMVIGSLALKTFQIWFLLKTANSRLEPRLIPAIQLMETLLALFVVDCLISALWIGISPPSLTRLQSSTPGTFIYKCWSPLSSVFSGVHVGWRALVLLVTTVVAFKCRHIPTVFNESRSTGFVIYNASFLGLLYVAMGPVIGETADYDLLLQVLCISVTMFVAMVLCFGVKARTWWYKTDAEIKQEIMLETRSGKVSVKGSTNTPVSMNSLPPVVTSTT